MKLDKQFAKDLFDLCLDFLVNESNTKGNWTILLRFPDSIEFDSLQDIRQFLTDYFSNDLPIEKIFKQEMFDCGEWADYYLYKLHFKSNYDVKSHYITYVD